MKNAQYRDRLMKMAARIRNVTSDLEEQARSTTGGDSGGNISNSPMHLGDIGSGVYSQQLSATLLENEEYILDEINAALHRLDDGTFGTCEHCHKKILAARLEALPYTRHCTRCAQELEDGVDVNLNNGRPQLAGEPMAAPSGGPASGVPDDRPSMTKLDPIPRHKPRDSHAAGTAGGGTAVGGLAGSTVGAGDPVPDLDDALGSGQFDATLDADDVDISAYAGRSGGAVGGTPAGKRATGGKPRRGGINPKSDNGDRPNKSR
ncbi:MAG: TraR/DksA family transcriptional regulator [Gemmataceae bacterium]